MVNRKTLSFLVGVLVALVAATLGCEDPKPGAATTTGGAARSAATAAGSAPSAAIAASAAPSAQNATSSATKELTATQDVKALAPDAPLVVGVTLHPYYSWTRAVVGDAKGVEVRALLPGEVDAGNYQPRPEDIDKLKSLNAIVINGLGHDDFIADMLKASGNQTVTVIRPNDGTPVIANVRGGEANSHTFISFSNAVQQTYAIEKVLSKMRPDLAEDFRKNAEAYAQRLRKIKADAAGKLAKVAAAKVVTVHDGYSYLCQEFGIEVAGVVEPSHGLVPSAAELGAMVDLLKKEKIQIVFSEESFPKDLLEVLERDGGAKVTVISHIASGDYTDDKFEKEMAANAEAMVSALGGGP